ncbi:Dimer_Tnp_hAT domain-containing protein [Cephalotus follicularis]|uniref:Dimer_Tnp_hAT domain-containing protein n=1 Tax=Cephalotus follicularis TaxID=3775 RepID=A0A1Q3BPK0_CEPFO|nr:Dimer_Tnp_hAT domain-containing protein [Cephalotus follicularis]
MLSKYPLSGPTNHLRHFQASWFQQFPCWLEYSPTVDVAFCLPCYVFSCKPNNRFGADAFKFYPDDFTEQEKLHLRIQLQHYEFDVTNRSELKKLLTIVELSHGLVKTEKSEIYHLVFRLIRLVLTLPVSTATTERSFSTMTIVKTRLRNKMKDEYLEDYLVTYVEKRIAMQFSTDSIIDDFYDMKEYRDRLC